MTRDEARAYAQREAEEAGLDEETADAAVNAAMSTFEDLEYDDEAFCDMVASVIQGHANS